MTIGRIWFDDDEYMEAEISFPSGSVWRLDEKIREHDYYESQDMEQLGVHSEARGTFFCSKVSGDGPPAALIKIRLQFRGMAQRKKAFDSCPAGYFRNPRQFQFRGRGFIAVN
ncbi:hypothetical protein BDV59DRAFT_178108 [Aspergillus ambiguus]|uniref:uncharacterized protein n=1 Tax=Aspergillus ambiguus TaxID=176160 RepID=UPI003CCD1741